MTLTPEEIRSLVTTYLKLRSEACPSVETGLLQLRAQIEQQCDEWCSRSRTMTWAAEHVGPVLAAGLGASANLKKVSNPMAYCRVAGLIIPRHYSPADAIDLLRACGITGINGEQPTLEQFKAVAERSGRRFGKVPESYADLVYALVRRTYSPFLRLVSLECAEALALSGGSYGQYYRQRIEELREQNERGELTSRLEATKRLYFTFDLNDIQQIVDQKVPNTSIISMAKHDLSRLFLADYYQRATRRANAA